MRLYGVEVSAYFPPTISTQENEVFDVANMTKHQNPGQSSDMQRMLKSGGSEKEGVIASSDHSSFRKMLSETIFPRCYTFGGNDYTN